MQLKSEPGVSPQHTSDNTEERTTTDENQQPHTAPAGLTAKKTRIYGLCIQQTSPVEGVQAGREAGDALSRRHVLHADAALVHRAGAVAGLLREHRDLRRGEPLLDGPPSGRVVFVWAWRILQEEK